MKIARGADGSWLHIGCDDDKVSALLIDTEIMALRKMLDTWDSLSKFGFDGVKTVSDDDLSLVVYQDDREFVINDISG